MAKWRNYKEPGYIPVNTGEEFVLKLGWAGNGRFDPAVHIPASIADTPEPEDDAPRAIGVLFGAQPGWSPARESQAFGHCNICGNGQLGTPIQPGSRIVCGGCGRYGYDKLIEVMLDENPAPEPDAQPKPPVQVKARFKPRG